MLQFLDGIDIHGDDVALVSLEYILNIDKSINDIADLKLDWLLEERKKTLNGEDKR